MLFRYAVYIFFAAESVFALPSSFARSKGADAKVPYLSSRHLKRNDAPSYSSNSSSNFPYGSTKVRGVNIGGWLVLEPWITPDIFAPYPGVVDEYTLGKTLDYGSALSVLRKHWETWASEADFEKIAKAGFNHVRIPIGYWAYHKFDNDPYVQGAAPYLDRAIGWARKAGLKVWIDLHGAPGSQNGFDNSGQLLSTPTWGQGNTVNQTLQVLTQMTTKYTRQEYQDVVAGIELLNEPFGQQLNDLENFYRSGYDLVRKGSNNTAVVLQDGFHWGWDFNGFLSDTDNITHNAQKVLLDHHEYQVFDNTLIQYSNERHRQAVCNSTQAFQYTDKWVVIGEWSGAMTDCAKWLNGKDVGARYDATFNKTATASAPAANITATGDCSHIRNSAEDWDPKLKDDTRKYIEAQLDVFEGNAQGWFFWNFKTQGSPEWDLFQLLDAELFPQPLDDRKFDRISCPK
ncbi:MAG: exo-1,3-beta-glucanase [Candelina submexicana]|nr:MAG: exo-1,3-beta-glucanase [Candelina submexicana]